MSLILCTVPLTEEQADRIRGAAPGYRLVYGKDKEQWMAALQDAEIIVGWRRMFEDAIVQNQTPLRWIQSWSAGVDYFPFQALSERGIALTTTSGIHAYPISESILAMMLGFTRKMHIHVRNQASGSWQRVEPVHEMHGKTAGIVGVGAIGEETARLLHAFGMRVIGLRQSGRPSPNVDEMVDSSGLEYLLKESDYVIVTLPLTNTTEKMFGRAEFQLMKRSAMFINIGRGGTVDEEALIEALQEGRIAGAGLDVFEREPLPSDSPLWKMEQVIVTPHIAGASEHYDERAFEIFMDNLGDYIRSGAPSANVVDYSKQY